MVNPAKQCGGILSIVIDNHFFTQLARQFFKRGADLAMFRRQPHDNRQIGFFDMVSPKRLGQGSR